MNRPHLIHAPDPLNRPSASQELARAVGLLAGRLASYLRRKLPGETEGLGTALQFLDHAFARAQRDGADAPLAGHWWQQPGQAPRTPLHKLSIILQLAPMEVDLLLLAGMAEEHEGYAEIFRTLHAGARPRPTVGLAAQLLCGSGDERRRLRELLAVGPGVVSGTLTLNGEGPFYENEIHCADYLWEVLHGIDIWPPQAQRIHSPAVIQGLEEWLKAPDTASARKALVHRRRCTIMIMADDERGAFHRATALARAAGLDWVGLQWPTETQPGLARLIGVHAMARRCVPILRLAYNEGPQMAVAPTLAHYPGPVLVCARSGLGEVSHGRPLLRVGAERLSAAALRRMWRSIVPALAHRADILAARYPLEPCQAIQIAGDLAFGKEGGDDPPGLDDVARAIHARAATNLGGGVQLVRPMATWRHLVLPPAQMQQLQEVVDRLLLQGKVLDDWRFLEGRRGARGVRMLFAGPPGTGKTLSAEVLARSLKVDLLQVDISRVVSKWIGETEKNLARVFDAAEAAKAIVLFDEADALFGKRTEVADAHDRYANLETAYLLSRLERFDGLVILSTNLRQNIDPAFMRRLEFTVEFAPPARKERLALWQCHLPPHAPLAADVDLEELAAHFAIVGGLIRNAAVAAAFLAAAEKTPIGRRHFLAAVRREYEKSGLAYREVRSR